MIHPILAGTPSWHGLRRGEGWCCLLHYLHGVFAVSKEAALARRVLALVLVGGRVRGGLRHVLPAQIHQYLYPPLMRVETLMSCVPSYLTAQRLPHKNKCFKLWEFATKNPN